MNDPLVRKLVRWSLMGVAGLALTALIGALATHAWGAHRLKNARADFDTRWGEIANPPRAPQVPEHLNGARWLVAGGQAIICSIEDLKFYGVLADRPARTWSDAEMSRAKRILHEQEAALELLLQSGSCDAFQLENGGLRANHHETDFLSIVRGLRLLVLHARIAWYEGRPMECLEALNAVSRAADGLMRTPVVMGSILGSGSARWVVWAASEVVSDPCTSSAVLARLRASLPSLEPVHAYDVTMAHSVAEVAREGLDYVEDFHDPSMGWSLPFWVSSPFLFEDLVVAENLDRWNRFLAAGQTPAAHWPPNPTAKIWGDPAWPPWLALGGTVTPNLFSVRVRAQTATTELHQLRLALDLRSAAPDGLVPDACAAVENGPPTALTGEPVTCRYDRERSAIIIDVPGGVDAIRGHSAIANRAEHLPPMELTVGSRDELCH